MSTRSISPGMAATRGPTSFCRDGPQGLVYIKSPIVMASSNTAGKTWSSVKAISDDAHPFNSGSQVGMARDGTLYVAYEGATPGSGYTQDALIIARSTDGGTTFTN